MSLVPGWQSGPVAGRMAPRIPPGAGPAPAAAAAGIRIDPWIGIAFVYPLSQLVMFAFVGQLYLMDLLAIPLLLMLLRLPGAAARLKGLGLLFALLALWLFSQMLTDLVRGSSPQDYLRGWARIVFFALQLAALWLWLPRRRAYIVAFALGLGLAALFGVPEQFAGNAWKFGFDRALAFIALGGLVWGAMALPQLRYLVPPVLLALALLLLLQAARSAFGILFLSAIITGTILLFAAAPGLRRRLSGWSYAVLLLGGATVAAGTTAIYTTAVEAGYLGRDALVKYRDQSSGEVPLILGGRTEALVSLRAIADSPLVGHGSWARDPRYVGLHHAIRVRLGLPAFDAEQGKRDLIPSHSYLMGSWVEAGIGGALVWLWVLVLALLAIYRLLKRDEVLAPLVAYCAVALLWSVLFSPFGSTERFFVAFQLVVVAQVMRAGGRPEQPE